MIHYQNAIAHPLLAVKFCNIFNFLLIIIFIFNSAENAIAARCDLNPPDGKYPFEALGYRQHGAIDVKLTTFDMEKQLQFVAVGGPTNDQVPSFQWSKTNFDVKHFGHPDLWNFDPIKVKWEFNH